MSEMCSNDFCLNFKNNGNNFFFIFRFNQRKVTRNRKIRTFGHSSVSIKFGQIRSNVRNYFGRTENFFVRGLNLQIPKISCVFKYNTNKEPILLVKLIFLCYLNDVIMLWCKPWHISPRRQYSTNPLLSITRARRSCQHKTFHFVENYQTSIWINAVFLSWFLDQVVYKVILCLKLANWVQLKWFQVPFIVWQKNIMEHVPTVG